MCVPEIWSNREKDNLNMSLWAENTHTHTHTHQVTLLTLICHLCDAFQQKTFIQNRTGHWELWDLQGLRLHHLQVCGELHPPLNFCIFIACFTWEHRERSACLRARLCASRCHFESHHFREFSFMAWQDCRSALCDSTAGLQQHFENGHSLHKHRCRFDHWTQS